MPNTLDWGSVYTARVSTRFLNDEPLIHLEIWRHNGEEIQATWSELQQIKNEMVGEDIPMMEFYPKSDKVVNEVNKRHFWSLPESIYGINLL